jgi:hypothetical protein
MSGILKVGMSNRTPDVRAKELYTTGVPLPFNIEFAKKVANPMTKEKIIHKILDQYTDRVNINREFFRVSPEEVKALFELIDGEWWVENSSGNTKTIEEEMKTIMDGEVVSPVLRKKRDMTKCFSDGQRIKHTIGINKTWIGVYNLSKNEIIYNEKCFKSLSGFTGYHYEVERPDRTSSSNGWGECECEVDGKWLSTHTF